MICASAVPICWPISVLTTCISVRPDGSMVNQIDGVNAAVRATVAALVPSAGTNAIPSAAPEPVAMERIRKSRRDSPPPLF